MASINHHDLPFCCLSLHLLVQPASQRLKVPLNPANIFLHVVQGNLSSSQLRRLFFDGLKEQLHLGVKHTYIYKNTDIFVFSSFVTLYTHNIAENANTNSMLQYWCISKLPCRIWISSRYKSAFTSVSSSGDENWPVVPMMMFLIQNEPNWNLQSQEPTERTVTD